MIRIPRVVLLPTQERAIRIALAVLVFGAAFVFVQLWDFTLPSLGAAKYQAVFLANGQTYFGRYYDRLGPYAKLESVYYIQQTPNPDPDKPPDSRIIRRGSELHAPRDAILVPKNAILFVEDLKEDSPVVRFIELDRARPRR